jgi:hypothetical protein
LGRGSYFTTSRSEAVLELLIVNLYGEIIVMYIQQVSMNHSLNLNHWIFLKIFSLMVVKIRMVEMRRDKRKTHLILTK